MARRKVGDWVLVRCVGYEPRVADAPHWVEIEVVHVVHPRDDMPYRSKFELGHYWYGEEHITPEHQITDAQWAELAKIRLVKGA